MKDSPKKILKRTEYNFNFLLPTPDKERTQNAG
jgi:hypothetical protein